MKRYKLLLTGYFKNADSFSVFYDKVNNCDVLTTAYGQEDLSDGWLDDLVQDIMQIEVVSDYFKALIDEDTLEWLQQWMQKGVKT